MPLPAIAGFGFVLGLIFPPLLLFVYSLVNVPYSSQLVVVNLLIVTGIGILLCIREGAFDFKLSFDYRRDAVWVLLLLIIVFAFWSRIQSISPIFYEFDPYYYDQMTEFILTQRQVPAIDNLAWYPYNDSHRNQPLPQYLEAQWYAIHGYVTNNQQFDNYLLATIAGAYPPVVAALVCFLAFVLVSEAYGRKYGLVSATLMAVMPMIVEKFAAGESEQQPWGIFAAFFFYAAYALAISRKDKRFAVLAGIAAISATLGSKQDVLVYLVAAGYTGLQSLVNFLQKKSNLELIKTSSIILAFTIFLGYLPYSLYLGWEVPSDMMSFGSAIIFALGLYLIDQRAKNQDERINYLAGYIILGAAIVFITFIPSFQLAVGPRVWNYIMAAASMAKPSAALYMTVAEQSPTAQQFASSIGFLGSSPDVLYAILILSGLSIVYSVYEGSELGILFGVMIFPVTYVGLNMSKYMLHVACMVCIAVAVIFGELDKVLRDFLKKQFGNWGTWGIFALAFIVLASECFVYPSSPPLFGGPVLDVVSGSLNPKYQLDNESISAPQGRDCTLLANDNQVMSYYLFCSRIPDYWMNPMIWIRDNVGENERVISWWDYGHWINYWGQKGCITRNDHSHPEMDLEVADKFVYNTPQALKDYMIAHNAKYVLFDQDLISKWGALNFLSCVYNNETNMSFAFSEGKKYNVPYELGTSQCEKEHDFERVYIPVNPTIDDYCQTSNPAQPYVRAYTTGNYTYCVLFNTQGQNRKILGMVYESNMSMEEHGTPYLGGVQSIGGKQYDVYTMLYTKDVWPDGKSGWDDRKGKIYDSTFYQGYFLGQLDGFEQVYPSPNQSSTVFPAVRIFKIKE
jgi:asparagine N-glycosylation enzyme membrane subunit Stt3